MLEITHNYFYLSYWRKMKIFTIRAEIFTNSTPFPTNKYITWKRFKIPLIFSFDYKFVLYDVKLNIFN